MKYYVTADPHGFFSNLKLALSNAGYFEDSEPHKLVVLGDLMDRGKEAKEMETFILKLLESDQVLLIRGNHEDLFEDMVTVDGGRALSHHVSNRTFDTALQLTNMTPYSAKKNRAQFAPAARRTSYYQTIIPAMKNYYETSHYIFVHGWIPCQKRLEGYLYSENWREADDDAWRRARWINGMDAAQTCDEKKTILCGHWHCSYGHAAYEKKGSEFGHDADFSPYYGPGVIALDACTAYSGQINVVVIEDD